MTWQDDIVDRMPPPPPERIERAKRRSRRSAKIGLAALLVGFALVPAAGYLGEWRLLWIAPFAIGLGLWKVTMARIVDRVIAKAVPADPADRIEQLERVIAGGVIAFQHTREYVGEDVLPEIAGWSWFDWCQRANAVLEGAERPCSTCGHPDAGTGLHFPSCTSPAT
jgi:hypothetical protein